MSRDTKRYISFWMLTWGTTLLMAVTNTRFGYIMYGITLVWGFIMFALSERDR